MKIRTTAALLTLGLLLVLGVPAAFAADPARLLVDARQGAPDLAQSFGYFPPVQFTEVAGHAIFLVDSFDLSGAYRAVPGPQVELWASDGTPAGTRQLAAFCQDGVESCHLPPRLLGRAGASRSSPAASPWATGCCWAPRPGPAPRSSGRPTVPPWRPAG
jgi:hypothetical protein